MTGASRWLRIVEAGCGVALGGCAVAGLTAAFPWITSDADGLAARIGLFLAFSVAAVWFLAGLFLHVVRNADAGLLLAWTGFPAVGLTASVFVGIFESWSPLFLPVLPLALVASCLAYVVWRSSTSSS
jgi:hypothetical protein